MIGIIAWSAVAIIIIIGVIRGQASGRSCWSACSMAIAAIPTGMPTFVQAMLAYGAKQLAEHKAVVKNLSDVETLGATSAINSDKTGTLTMNQMMVRSLYFRGHVVHRAGRGLRQDGGHPPDGRRAGAGLHPTGVRAVPGQRCDGLRLWRGHRRSHGGRRWWCWPRRWASTPNRRAAAYPRLAEVPFDSAYKFMATFHHLPIDGEPHFVELVKGGPDVVLARCSMALLPSGESSPIGDVRDDILNANASLSRERSAGPGLRREEAGRPGSRGAPRIR